MLTAETLGEALRLLLHRSSLRQDSLAKELQISSGSVSAYLNDTAVPPAPLLRAMANVFANKLGIAPDAIWTEFGKVVDGSSRLAQVKAEGAVLSRHQGT